MKIFYCIIVGLLLVSCQKMTDSKTPIISEENLQRHVQVLSSDAFEGRKPFTAGESKTIDYIKGEFEAIGVEPGNNGSFFQEVPLVSIEAANMEEMVITGEGISMNLKFKSDFVALSRRVTERIEVQNSELVFAGFGIVAPEYDWDDYAGIDVEGKTVVVLVNDPGFGSDDDSRFKGNTMTYYGRWTYKYEEAARQGAAGVIIVHDTKPASYPWGVVESGWTGANLYLNSSDDNMSRCSFEGWITRDRAVEVFKASGMEDYDFTAAARKGDFKPFNLGLKVSLAFDNILDASESNNVVGVLPGTDRADEYIIYSAHWDHMGIGPVVDGDSIYNGAIDNASGIAAMIELARAHKNAGPKSRSVMFLAVTAEEQGLLGSEYYAANPIQPVEKTIANINMDALGSYGPMKDVTIVGYGQSELDDYASEIAETQGRYVMPNPTPEKGSFFRSDHFNFAKIGIPALYAAGRYEHAEKGIEYAREQIENYTKNHYHQPSDEYRPEESDFSGMVIDAEFYFLVCAKLADEATFPAWKEGSEFKSTREESLK